MDVVFGELMIDGGRDEADYISGDGIVGGGFATLHRISLCGGCVARFAADWDQVRVIEDLGECGDAHRPSLMQNITALPTLPSLSRLTLLNIKSFTPTVLWQHIVAVATTTLFRLTLGWFVGRGLLVRSEVSIVQEYPLIPGEQQVLVLLC
ncbi:uncharacterized protein LOC124684755 isoform X4 [Lolium rigidum]|uniref:uncharacterized protein LOC124684755 isoform X4 n=1 Tax=Lolium rigidum TaxID=89674 RepID=UPI001F5D67DB|nr:uncharacterized protein LOC124684755 isoform X4 [Lolium rigidum]